MIDNNEIENELEEEEDVHDYFSVLGDSLIEPIVVLVDKATSTRLAGPNQVQASCIENGYSSAIILLLVVMLEGMINFVWLHYSGFESKKNRYSALMALKYYTQNKYNSEIDELFIIRDVIAHNHIWETKIYSGPRKMVHTKTPNLRDEFGDKKYIENVDIDTRLTKKLTLNVFTTRINWNDVEIVFDNIIHLLNCVENNLKIRSLTRVGRHKFNGSWIYFDQLLEEVHKKREKDDYL